MSLKAEPCEACRADAPTVSRDERSDLLQQIPQWRIVSEAGEDKLRREFTFADFAAALAFTIRVGELAETVNHHPALLTEWGKVTVSWWSHKLGGLHRNDFRLAAKTDELL
ncbi:MAG TPA: 4a-hydroxytetrahydrobiopterin dehydratase [Gammaproteobacteria bacterium]|nr:4a-hydroxytetrahydrobiopterin dehydratase [Gammaproteobacteria bacterium]